jgi:uncharacterized membrane protein YgdD (TMEM256/DUF423 family)
MEKLYFYENKTMMYKMFLVCGSILSALAVILGAFGAHALKSKLSVENIATFETGVKYQMYHSFALILIFLLSSKINSPLLNYAGVLFLIGIIFFSGSIYLLSCREVFGIEEWKRFLGPITPLGGLCFISGWICVIISSIKFKM